MPTYCVRFRGDKEELCIEADRMGDRGDSYVFYDASGNIEDKDTIVAQVPKDVVLSVIEEKLTGGPT